MSVPTDELSMTQRNVPPSEKFSNAETIRTNTYINYTWIKRVMSHGCLDSLFMVEKLEQDSTDRFDRTK